MRNLHPLARAAIVALGALLVGNLVVGGVDRAAGGRRPGMRSSTYTTAPDGLAALEVLLRRHGRDVVRLRRPLAEAPPAAGATVFVVEGIPDPQDAGVLARFVDAGGRLVAAGPQTEAWLPQVISTTASWDPAASGDAALLVPVPEVIGVATVRSPEPGSWTDAGRGLPVLAGEQGSLLFVQRRGAGRVAALASASPLHNAHLDEADNAALGLALGGTERVYFLESVHGHSDGRGLGALPSDAKWAFALLAIAGCAWLVVRGRRLGPPERRDRGLAPPRHLYVEALGAALARTRPRADALAGVRNAARQHLLRRAGVRAAADVDALRRVAAQLGLEPDEVDAILIPATGDREVVAAGRALAKLESRT